MSTPLERIQTDLKTAMKAQDKERTGCLRMLLAEIKNEAIRAGQPVDEERFVGLVRKGIKQRTESAEQFRKGGRDESADHEEREKVLLEAYLPAQASEADIAQAVEDYVAAQDLSGPAAMGAVMKAMLERFGSTADGRTLSRIVKETLVPKPPAKG
jgi:uncharacterized protein YqeY